MYPNPAQHKKKKFPLSKEKKETPMMTTTGFFKTKTRLLPSAESPLQEQVHKKMTKILEGPGSQVSEGSNQE
jgi:hypothetical protein